MGRLTPRNTRWVAIVSTLILGALFPLAVAGGASGEAPTSLLGPTEERPASERGTYGGIFDALAAAGPRSVAEGVPGQGGPRSGSRPGGQQPAGARRPAGGEARSQSKAESVRALLQTAQGQAAVRVIVGLAVPYLPEGEIASALAVGIQRNRIAQAQDALLDRLETAEVRTVARFEVIPYLVLETNAEGLAVLAADPLISTVHEDVPHPVALAESVPLIGADHAWASGYTGRGQTIAVLDTGVDRSHSMLAGKVAAEACFSTTFPSGGSTSVCPDGSGQQTGPGAGRPCSVSGCDHGTHVAGIAAGNAISLAGVAREANLIAVQVFSRFDGFSCGTGDPCVQAYTSDIIRGLEYVYGLRSQMSIAAVNMSLGGDGYSAPCDADEPEMKAIIDTLRSVGIATVIASGNNGYTGAISSPACISSAVSVGSTTKSDSVSGYSNSATFLSLLAPGSSITSSIPGGSFASFSGTSMAAPHVAGAWAVLKSKAPGASVEQVLNALTSSGLLIRDGRNGLQKPRIQVDAALTRLPGGPTATPTQSGTPGPTFTPSATVTQTGTPRVTLTPTQSTTPVPGGPNLAIKPLGAWEVVLLSGEGQFSFEVRNTSSSDAARSVKVRIEELRRWAINDWIVSQKMTIPEIGPGQAWQGAFTWRPLTDCGGRFYIRIVVEDGRADSDDVAPSLQGHEVSVFGCPYLPNIKPQRDSAWPVSVRLRQQVTFNYKILNTDCTETVDYVFEEGFSVRKVGQPWPTTPDATARINGLTNSGGYDEQGELVCDPQPAFKPGTFTWTFQETGSYQMRIDSDRGKSVVEYNETDNQLLHTVVVVGDQPSFVDVPFEHWANPYVEAIYLNGLVAGCETSPARKYCPQDPLTRASAAVFVVRGVHGAAFLPPLPTEPIFSDVSPSAWYAKWAHQLWLDGFTSGCATSPLRFCPDAPHTRAEATVFFVRLKLGKDYQPPEPSAAVYADVALGTWYAKWVYAARAEGLTEGCEDLANQGDGLFRPLAEITRAEAACMMARAKGLAGP